MHCFNNVGNIFFSPLCLNLLYIFYFFCASSPIILPCFFLVYNSSVCLPVSLSMLDFFSINLPYLFLFLQCIISQHFTTFPHRFTLVCCSFVSYFMFYHPSLPYFSRDYYYYYIIITNFLYFLSGTLRNRPMFLSSLAALKARSLGTLLLGLVWT